MFHLCTLPKSLVNHGFDWVLMNLRIMKETAPKLLGKKDKFIIKSQTFSFALFPVKLKLVRYCKHIHRYPLILQSLVMIALILFILLLSGSKEACV